MIDDSQFQDDDINADPGRQLVESLVYGDPADVVQKLGTFVEGHLRGREDAIRLQTDLARSKAALASFASDNPDLIKDGMAQAAVEHRIYDLYVEDIRKLGVPDEKLPRNADGTINRDVIARWHSWYRANGHNV
jgi:hypothetical protein